MNLVATANDKRVTINGRSMTIAPGGWPEEVAKVEWFGDRGALTLIDGHVVRFSDDGVIVPLVIAWRTAEARALAAKRMGWRARLRRWLQGAQCLPS